MPRHAWVVSRLKADRKTTPPFTGHTETGPCDRTTAVLRGTAWGGRGARGKGSPGGAACLFLGHTIKPVCYVPSPPHTRTRYIYGPQ